MLKTSSHALSTSRKKAYDRVPCEKLWEVSREYGVDDRLLLAVMSLYSCSEVCVRVERVKSLPFTVGVESDKGVCCHRSFS